MADDSFKEFVLDQLGALPELRARAMFGAQGLYAGGRFFGIFGRGPAVFQNGLTIAGGLHGARHGTVHLRDEGARMTMSYHEVPPDVLGKPGRVGVLGAPCDSNRRRQQEVAQVVPAKSRPAQVRKVVIRF